MFFDQASIRPGGARPVCMNAGSTTFVVIFSFLNSGATDGVIAYTS